MNVLQVLPELRVGGVETGTLDLAKHLVRLGHKAVVVSNGGELVKDLTAGGAIHYSLPVHKKSLLSALKLVSQLAEIIRREEIDIVHARSRVPAWIAYFASRLTGRMFVTTCHGYYKKHFFSRVMGWAKRVIVPSQAIGRRMVDDFGVPHERIRLIPRSVDLERFKFLPQEKKTGNEFNVGIIGRLTPIKGHPCFIKAMAQVIKAVPGLKIWIVGDAPDSKAAYKEHLEDLVKRSGLWHCTQFLGTQKDVPEVLRHLNLLVLATTTQEAFGRVIIEAQASGVAVVATNVGGVVDIIEDNKTGLLVTAADPDAMALAVIRIAQDGNLAGKLAQNAYKRVKEKYTVEQMVRHTIEVYKEALDEVKALVIKFSSLGDVILTSAAIRALRERFPGQDGVHKNEISVLVGDASKEALLTCPYIDELLVCDFKNKEKGVAGFLRLASSLRKKNFDLVIDLQNNRKSHLLAWLSLALHRYGYDNKKLGFLLNHRIKDDKPKIGPVPHQFRILHLLGIELKNPHLELWPTPQDEHYVEELLSSEWISPQHKLVGINIAASQRWATKAWPFAYLVKLCEELGHRDMRAVLTGTENDIPSANALIAKVKNVKPINGCGKTSVNQLACLIRRCNAYVSGDSAPLHIAASQDTPLVAIFGPTDPERHMPPVKHCVVLKAKTACSPCYRPTCSRRKCLEQIKPGDVLNAIETLLK